MESKAQTLFTIQEIVDAQVKQALNRFCSELIGSLESERYYATETGAHSRASTIMSVMDAVRSTAEEIE